MHAVNVAKKCMSQKKPEEEEKIVKSGGNKFKKKCDHCGKTGHN